MNNFQRLSLDDTFRFACRPGVECFNMCCRDLNQFLTPYDILRLKQRLDLLSGTFLGRYTSHHIGPQSGLPIVTLKMQEARDLQCPFVSESGCMVYPDRPGACRTYPLARISHRRPGQPSCEEVHVVVREAHCLGFREADEWTVRAWKEAQGVDAYNEMNDLLLEIISLKNRSGRKRLAPFENDLFYLACYDLDRFRDFVFEKGLCREHPDRERLTGKLETDDLALMRFGIEWIKKTIFGGLLL